MSLLAAFAAFVLGFFILPQALPGLKVHGPYGGARSALLGGLVSVGLGKLVLMFLTIVFFPILLLGPLAAVLAYTIANFVILMASEYIFDEVDTGVGGPTAEAIGRKLQSVGARRQALCVTHLPQIAAMGQQHLHVSKEIVDERTRSIVSSLSRDERIEELARMLGGATITRTTRANARELLKLAKAG